VGVVVLSSVLTTDVTIRWPFLSKNDIPALTLCLHVHKASEQANIFKTLNVYYDGEGNNKKVWVQQVKPRIGL